MKHCSFKTAIPFLKYIFALLPTGTYQLYCWFKLLKKTQPDEILMYIKE